MKRLLIYVLPALTLLIAGCAPESVGVPVHAVNHTEDEISYMIVDPADKENSAGGESINPYEAGGLMCCYSVPAKWQPGIKVELQAEVWLTSQPNGSDGSPQIEKQSVILDLPKPGDGEPSELWVIRNPDGTFELVASNVGPSHPKWPGKIKGMPTVSKTYLEKLLRRDLEETGRILRRFSALKRELDMDPAPYAKENWEFRKEQGEFALLATYKGPDDKRYVEFLKSEADEMTIYAEERIFKLKKALSQ